MLKVAVVLVVTIAGGAAAQNTGQSTGNYGSQDLARGGESDVNNWPLSSSSPASTRQQAAAYEQAQDYGRCAARIAPKVAASVLNAGVNTANERNAMVQLNASGRPCLAYGANPPNAFVRGGLAEALYARAPAAPAAPTPERMAAFQAAETARGTSYGAGGGDWTAYMTCAVSRAPDQVRALLKSKAGSKPERAAYDAVKAGTAECSGKDQLPAAGVSPGFRTLLAEAAWRWGSFGQPS